MDLQKSYKVIIYLHFFYVFELIAVLKAMFSADMVAFVCLPFSCVGR